MYINRFKNQDKQVFIIRDMGIAGLNLKFNKKVKTNVERESIFIFKKSSDRAIRAGGMDLEVLNSDGVICCTKFSNILLLLISFGLMLPVLKDLSICCEILIFSCFKVIPTYDAGNKKNHLFCSEPLPFINIDIIGSFLFSSDFQLFLNQVSFFFILPVETMEHKQKCASSCSQFESISKIKQKYLPRLHPMY